MDRTMWMILAISAGIGVFIGIVVGISEKKKLDELNRYWDVEIGMTDDEMLSIMRGRCNGSLLKNNRIKYEWRINARSYGSIIKGVRKYSGVKKVTIYTRNGYVEEIKPYNV